MDLAFPSPDFPSPPSLRLVVPTGWVYVDLPDAVAAAADPASPPEFTTNLLVTVNRVVGELSLDEVVERQLSSATEGLGGRIDRQEHRPLAGSDAVWSAMSFPARGDRPVPLFQAQATLVVPRRARVADAVTLVATCAQSLASHYSPLFRESFHSLVIAV